MTALTWLVLAALAGSLIAAVGVIVVRRHRAAPQAMQDSGDEGARMDAASTAHPASRAREVRSQNSLARRTLQAASMRNDEVVVAVASAMADHVGAQVVAELAATPIGGLRSLTSVSGIRLSAIGSAGFSNVAQVLAAGSGRLQQIPGIGPASATQLIAAAAEVRDSAFRRANYGLRSSTPSPEQSALLTQLWRFTSVRRDLEVAPRQLVNQERQLRQLGRSLWLPSVRPLWFLLLGRRRRTWATRVDTVGRRVEGVVAGDFMRQARAVLDAEGDPPGVEALWRWVADDRPAVTTGLEAAVQAMLGAGSAAALLSRPRKTIPLRPVGDVIARRVAQVSRPRPGFHAAPAVGSGVDDTTALYRLYDAAGGLLYVGISNDVHGRIRTHRMDKHWGPAVADARIEWYLTRAAALAAEAGAIRRERPRHNVMHNR